MKPDPENDAANRAGDSGKGRKLVGKVVGGIIVVAIVWLTFGGRITYAVAECSKGVKQCAVGIAVALGIVDVYDKDGRCTGGGCNF